MVYEDISEQKKILSELISAKIKAEESDHLKTAFLANMSHEIRTPMNGILGFMDLLQQPDLSEDQVDEYIKIVKISGERLLSTINDIIDISKIEAGQSDLVETAVDVNLLLLEHYNFFKREAEQKGIKIEIISMLPENGQVIKTDYKKLSSVLTNLIKNALKFTKKGGITIGTEIKEGFIEFSISDTGKGIPKEKIKSIFDRFIQVDNSIARDHEGSGLGLSISKAYVEMLGGQISVTSKPEIGSTFVFTIPYSHIQVQLPVKMTEKNSSESLENKTILIAEDDEISYIYLSRMLALYKLNIIRAYNGQDAIELLEANPDVCIIIMDIKMPIMDGYQATRIIREKGINIPILALTAFAFSDDKEKALAAGCNDYLSKPVKKEKLIDMIKYYNQYNTITT
jgi:CheY-like chemotaxis protein/nitrogen-specific signal transduction histidine kinase